MNIIFAQLAEAIADAPWWLQLLERFGFPVFCAMAIGWALWQIGKKLLAVHERFTDSIIHQNAKQGGDIGTLVELHRDGVATQQSIDAKLDRQTGLLEKQTELLREISHGKRVN
jgi:hypothetical protein